MMGYGLNGRNLARVLHETEIPYVVVDLDGEKVRRESKTGVPIYYGDATNPSVLRHLRIDDARVLVIAISDPFYARRTVQIARGLNKSLHIIVRTRYLRELDELHQLGADEVVPEEFERRSRSLPWCSAPTSCPRTSSSIRPNRCEEKAMPCSGAPACRDSLSCQRGTRPMWKSRPAVEPDSPAVGKTLAQVSIWPRTGASVIALARAGVTESNPPEKTHLRAGDVVVLLGSRDQIQRAIGLLAGS